MRKPYGHFGLVFRYLNPTEYFTLEFSANYVRIREFANNNVR